MLRWNGTGSVSWRAGGVKAWAEGTESQLISLVCLDGHRSCIWWQRHAYPIMSHCVLVSTTGGGDGVAGMHAPQRIQPRVFAVLCCAVLCHAAPVTHPVPGVESWPPMPPPLSGEFWHELLSRSFKRSDSSRCFHSLHTMFFITSYVALSVATAIFVATTLLCSFIIKLPASCTTAHWYTVWYSWRGLPRELRLLQHDSCCSTLSVLLPYMS